MREQASKKNHLGQREQRMYSFLRTNSVGVLSTVDPDGNPHGAVIYYTVDKNFIVAFLTKTETRKYDNLKHNSHVMVTIFNARSQATVQIVGTASEVEDHGEINRIATAVQTASIAKNGIGLLPISKLEAGGYTAFKIVPIQVRMAVFSQSDSGEYEDIFESVESFELNGLEH